MVPASVRTVVGIDVAKARHVVCALEVPGEAVRLPPTPVDASAAGTAQLLGWLAEWSGGEPETALVGLEATGSLWEPLEAALSAAGYPVLVLNPRQVAAWSTGQGRRAKTDAQDARTLAHGLVTGWGKASTVPSETVQALRTLTRARHDLVQSQSATRERLHDALGLVFPELVGHLPRHADLAHPVVLTLLRHYPSAHALAQAPVAEVTTCLQQASAATGPAATAARPWGVEEAQALQTLAQPSAASPHALGARELVVQTLAAQLQELRAHLAELARAIAALMADDADSRRLQQQVPGLGPQITAVIRAEVGDVQRFHGEAQVVAYAGLEPRTRESGRRKGERHLSKHGPGALRHALYLAAVVAVRCAPEWHAHYQRLLDRGRVRKEALVILARRMLRVIFHLLRSGNAYDPARVTWVNPGRPAGQG